MALSESLGRLNMASYRASRGVPWDPARFIASWAEFENLAVIDGQQCCGFIRLVREGDALAIRDLQVIPELQGRGIGSWAITQAKQIGAERGYGLLQLRVYPENPAIRLYSKLGFSVERIEGEVVHMRCSIPRTQGQSVI
jgi:ribosomal protein S18 acetylase RimI-like enzyme